MINNYHKLRSTFLSRSSRVGLILVFQIGAAKFIQAEYVVEAHFLISIFHFRPIIIIPSQTNLYSFVEKYLIFIYLET